jgi:hypothetical protein
MVAAAVAAVVTTMVQKRWCGDAVMESYDRCQDGVASIFDVCALLLHTIQCAAYHMHAAPSLIVLDHSLSPDIQRYTTR